MSPKEVDIFTLDIIRSSFEVLSIIVQFRSFDSPLCDSLKMTSIVQFRSFDSSLCDSLKMTCIRKSGVLE